MFINQHNVLTQLGDYCFDRRSCSLIFLTNLFNVTCEVTLSFVLVRFLPCLICTLKIKNRSASCSSTHVLKMTSKRSKGIFRALAFCRIRPIFICRSTQHLTKTSSSSSSTRTQTIKANIKFTLFMRIFPLPQYTFFLLLSG